MRTRLFTVGVLSVAALACGNPTGPSPNTARPPASVGHELVYHDGLGAVLLVNAGLGGPDDASKAGQRTKLWAWRGQAWELIDSAGPPIRNLGGVAYDRRRNVLVLYGGTFSEALSYGDTWEWVPAGWRQVNVQGPGIRHHAQMVFDEARAAVVLAAGQGAGTTFPADVWSFDGAQWTRVADQTNVRRVHHALIYDAVRQKPLLIAGSVPGASDVGETLQLENGAWSATPSLSLAPRTHARGVFVDGIGVMLVGGFSSGGLSDAVLVSSAQGWQAQTGTRPSARYLTALAYDRSRQVVVLYGGGNNSGLLDDTWEWDGRDWQAR